MDFLSALKKIKSGDHRTQAALWTDIPETTIRDKNGTDDKTESVKINTSTEDTTDTTELDKSLTITNNPTPPTNPDSEDSSTTVIIEAHVYYFITEPPVIIHLRDHLNVSSNILQQVVLIK